MINEKEDTKSTQCFQKLCSTSSGQETETKSYIREEKVIPSIKSATYQEILERWVAYLQVFSHQGNYNTITSGYVEQREEARAKLLLVSESEIDDPLSTRPIPTPEKETKALIELDLTRTGLLQEKKTLSKTELFEVLFTWTHTHRSLGYRQGMNELAAFLGFVVQSSGLKTGNAATPSALTYALFCHLMERGMQGYYEFRENGRKLPLTRKINHISRKLLRARDIKLYQHLENLRLEPSVYLVRWIRLLFLRETTEQAALELWDYYISKMETRYNVSVDGAPATLDVVDVVSLAVLTSSREKLVRTRGDYEAIEILQSVKCTDFSQIKAICNSITRCLIRGCRKGIASKDRIGEDTRD